MSSQILVDLHFVLDRVHHYRAGSAERHLYFHHRTTHSFDAGWWGVHSEDEERITDLLLVLVISLHTRVSVVNPWVTVELVQGDDAADFLVEHTRSWRLDPSLEVRLWSSNHSEV